MIKINDEYYINAIPTCIVLQRVYTIQDKDSKNYGEEARENLGYYSNIESALDGLLKHETRKFIAKEDINTLQDLKKELTKIEKMIKKACEGLLDK